jgi:hypothetical protein
MYAGNDDWLNRAYLRSGLNEFQKVAQPLRKDLPHGAYIHGPEESDNPLVHIVYRMRRIEVYKRSVATSDEIANVATQWGDEVSDHAVQILLLNDLQRYLMQEKWTKLYDVEIVEQACDWFEKNQRQFGASWILKVAIMQYCEELHSHYAQGAASE